MAEAFKNLLGEALVLAFGWHLKRAWPAFDRQRFQRLALDGLDALEMKQRALQIVAALTATLPEDFNRSADILEASLGPAGVGDDLAALRTSNAGLAGWAIWPLSEYVARRGQAQPERALSTLHAMTQRFSTEWAIRPFIEQHPELTFATLQRWTTDPSAHVRRLVSEGSRPRLPWGLQLKGLIADPAPTLPLLLALQDDPSEYVRRSVANHLNDIAKDHPMRVVQWVASHLQDAPGERRALLRHASRTLIKLGHPAMLKVWGLGRCLVGEASVHVAPRRVAVGGSLSLDVTLRSTSARPQKLVIDYAVHHVKANGSTSPKVFKGWTLDLAAHEQRELKKNHSMRLVTTRRYHAGPHVVDLRVNGKAVASAAFDLHV